MPDHVPVPRSAVDEIEAANLDPGGLGPGAYGGTRAGFTAIGRSVHFLCPP